MFTLKELEIIKTAVNSLIDDMDEFPNDYTPEYKNDVSKLSENVEIQILIKKL